MNTKPQSETKEQTVVSATTASHAPNLYKLQFGNTQIVVRESSIYKKKIHKITESLEIKKLGQLSVG